MSAALAQRVRNMLLQRKPGFELTDGDIAVESGITRRQVAMLLEEFVASGTLAGRAAGGVHYYRLPGTALVAPAAPSPSPAAPAAASAFDPAALQPKPFDEPPPVNRWGARRETCLAIIERLTAPKLCLEGIPKAYHATLKALALERSRTSVERYVFRKPTPATVAIYRIADAAGPLSAAPAPAPKPAKKPAKAKP